MQSMDQILDKLVLAHINGSEMKKEKKIVVLGLRGKIVPPPILAQSNNFFHKTLYLSIPNNEKVQISKSKPKKISILCTFKAKRLIYQT
jgi:hypothetical protein